MSERASERIDTGARRTGDLALCALFVVAIALPLALQATGASSAPDVTREFRRPAPKPELRFERESLLAFPKSFSAWFGDVFGLRSILIRWHNLLKLEGFHVTPTSELVLGGDHWLYTSRDHAVDVYRGLYPFTPAELELWRKVLEDRRTWLAQRGIAYLFAVGPNKESIYPEHWPAALSPVGPNRLDQLIEHLEQRSDFRVLDLRPALLAAKRDFAAEGDVFFQLGTHWNDRGALYAYRALMEEVARLVPFAKPRPLAAFTFQPTDFQDDSWAGRLYMEDRLRQPNVAIQFEHRAEERPLARQIDMAYEVDDPALPSAVFFQDSYGDKLRALLAEDFRRIAFHYVSDFDTEAIEREKPDVVIQLFAERAFAAVLPSTSPLDTPEVLAPQLESSREVLFDARRSPDALSTDGGMEVLAPPGAEGSVAVLRNTGGSLVLGDFKMPEGALALVRIEIDSPAAGLLSLEFLTARESTYSTQARAARRLLAPGRNVVLVKLLVPDLRGPLRVRLPAAGDYLLRSLEVRAVR